MRSLSPALKNRILTMLDVSHSAHTIASTAGITALLEKLVMHCFEKK
jgi:hypothetical protein